MKIISNAYSLSKQNKIMKFIREVTIFFFINVTKDFFQQRIRKKNRWKTTFVTSHRDLKQFMIVTMSLSSTSEFFQQTMKSILFKYLWFFALMYVDDIIIYSRFLEKHLTYLKLIFEVLKDLKVSMLLKKCYFAYSLIALLEHHISHLKVFTVKDKIKTIKNLTFLKSFMQLENDLELFEYYWDFVNHYAAMIELLEKLKIICFKLASRKERARKNFVSRHQLWSLKLLKKMKQLVDNAKIFWKEIKNRLMTALIRVYSNFFKSFIIYTNNSKEREYDSALHQIEVNEIEKLILFLFKRLSTAEWNY